MIKAKRSQLRHGCKTPVASETDISITYHTGLPRQDTGWVISTPKSVSPDTRNIIILPLYVTSISNISARAHTHKMSIQISLGNFFTFSGILQFLCPNAACFCHKQGLLVFFLKMQENQWRNREGQPPFK